MEHPANQSIISLIGLEGQHDIFYEVGARLPHSQDTITDIIHDENWFLVYFGNKLLARVSTLAIAEVRYVGRYD